MFVASKNGLPFVLNVYHLSLDGFKRFKSYAVTIPNLIAADWIGKKSFPFFTKLMHGRQITVHWYIVKYCKALISIGRFLPAVFLL